MDHGTLSGDYLAKSMFCDFGIFLFLGIGLFLTGVKILLAMMNWELIDSWTASYGINPDQPISSFTFSRVLSPLCLLSVAPLTLKSRWSRILTKKAYHLVKEARNKIWSQALTRHSYLYQEEYAHLRRKIWMIFISSKSLGWVSLATDWARVRRAPRYDLLKTEFQLTF